MVRLLQSAIGLGMAVAGADKIAGDRRYDDLFRSWGWSTNAMKWFGTAEVFGGTLMAFDRTRRLGGAILAVSSGVVLASEVQHKSALTAPRLGVMTVALSALLA